MSDNFMQDVVRDIVSMLENGTSNDIKILLLDGSLKVNKDILMARSSYFKSLLGIYSIF